MSRAVERACRLAQQSLSPAEAQHRLDELLALPFDAALARAQEDPRYHHPAVAQVLADRAVHLLQCPSPAPLRELALLGLALVKRLDEAAGAPRLAADLRATFQCCLARHGLTGGRDRAAARALTAARSLLTTGTGDPLVLALVAHEEGLLRLHRGEMASARSHLEQAASLYHSVGEEAQEGWARASLARTSPGEAPPANPAYPGDGDAC